MQELAGKFIPATDEVWRLQHRDDPECQFFHQIARDGHYKPDNRTQQGIYCCTPGGVLLGSLNSTNPNQVFRLLTRSWEAWEAMPAEERGKRVDTSAWKVSRVESRQPTDGMILSVFSRDLPESLEPGDACSEKWNRDVAWFSAAEARALVPESLVEGASREWPEAVARRFIALHLVDMVNGQTQSFPRESLSDSMIRTTVTAVGGNQVAVRFDGRTQARVEASRETRWPRGMRTTVYGTGVFDVTEARFTSLQIVATGYRFGRTEFNFRPKGEMTEHPIGFAISLEPSDRWGAAPAFIWDYQADWLWR